jgi:dihydrofolate synthase/folylpolyglutamate synthase
VILDVAHNPQAASVLAANLAAMGGVGRTLAVVGMLRDKDLAGVASKLAGRIDRWFVATLDNPRGATADEVAAAIAATRPDADVQRFASARAAFAAALGAAEQGDRIVVFGSFYTVADVMTAHAAPSRLPDGR